MRIGFRLRVGGAVALFVCLLLGVAAVAVARAGASVSVARARWGHLTAAGRAVDSSAAALSVNARLSSILERDPGDSVALSAVAGAPAAAWAPSGAARAAAGAAQAAAVGAAVDPDDVEVVQTTANLSQHLTRLHDLEFRSPAGAPAAQVRVLHVSDSVGYQRISGFGAAMTDSSAWLLYDELTPATRAKVMQTLFGTSGIHLDFLRVPIGASDFTRNGQPYTYDDLPSGRSDPSLSHFSIAHDQAYVLPALHQALSIDPETTLLASPWSPPAWMKGNDALNNTAHRGTLRWSDAGAWARYLVRFIQAYDRAGVPVSDLTIQNEPTNATAYPGLELSEPAEANFLKTRLTPALRAAHVGVRVYGDDWGWGPRATRYAKMLVADHAADRDLSGIAWHCYFGSPYLMSAVRSMDTSLDQVEDECSPGITPFPMAEVVIGSIRNWASTVALWNLALDPHGGPVQPPNSGCPGCSGLVTVNEQTHTATYRLAYFQVGQASAFVQRGARRIDSEHYVSYDYTRPGVNMVTPGLDDVAFVNPDGSHVLVAYDNSSRPITFQVDWQGRSVTYQLPAEAMVTLVWDRKG